MERSLYKYRTELHAHTSPASRCGHIPSAELVKIYSEKGYDSMVITNHFTHDMEYVQDKRKCIDSYLADFYTAAEAGERYSLNVILGAEIRFSENWNDYLVYGIDTNFFENAYEYLNAGICAFSKDFRGEDIVLLQAHPFRDGMERTDIKYLDGIEVFNMHPGHNSRIAMAAQYAKSCGCIAIAGSDCHDYGCEGLCAILTKERLKDSHDVAKALKQRDYLLDVGGFLVEPPMYSDGVLPTASLNTFVK